MVKNRDNIAEVAHILQNQDKIDLQNLTSENIEQLYQINESLSEEELLSILQQEGFEATELLTELVEVTEFASHAATAEPSQATTPTQEPTSFATSEATILPTQEATSLPSQKTPIDPIETLTPKASDNSRQGLSTAEQAGIGIGALGAVAICYLLKKYNKVSANRKLEDLARKALENPDEIIDEIINSKNPQEAEKQVNAKLEQGIRSSKPSTSIKSADAIAALRNKQEERGIGV